MTGGCSVTNLEAVRNTFIFNFGQAHEMKSAEPLKMCRYGHVSIELGNRVYVLGGFDHKDDELNNPNTLNSCEFLCHGE